MASEDAASSQPKPTKAMGEAFLYDECFGMAAFEFGSVTDSRRALVCVGGLTDGLLSMRYLPLLAEAVAEERWRVVQPILCSSYSGWGTSSVDEDAAGLDKLLDYLESRRGVEEVVLLGHSTGCQDAVRYLAVGKRKDMVRAAILQAPVSDREALPLTCSGPEAEFEESLGRFREMAEKMVDEGRGSEVMPRAASDLLGPPHPVSAYRFHSLTGRLTDDDMFSSDLTDDELRAKLGHIAVPMLLAVSEDDEYVPKDVDARALASRMASAMASGATGQVDVLPLDEAGHGLKTDSSKSAFVAGVQSFLRRRCSGAGAAGVSWEVGAAAEIRRRASNAKADGRPFLVALAGIPGAGKSVSAAVLGRLLGPSCLVVPMDGFHVPMAGLRARPDAEDAIYRRGAPDTFDPAALRDKLAAIKGSDSASPAAAEVLLPAFEHAAGDPVDGAVAFVRARHEVVLVEGLYLLHDADGWQGTSELFDLRLFLDADIDAAIAVVKERNKVIPGYTPEEVEVRAERVERKCAITVQRSRAHADLVVSRAGAGSP